MTCSFDIEYFRSQVTPVPGDPSAQELFQQQLESYLTRLVDAIAVSVNCIDENCCDGGGGGGGVTEFTELTDTPASYVGQSGKFVTVKATENALVFTSPSAVPDSDGLTLDLSTSEQATLRTDLAGATIYQKTINFGTLPSTTSKDVAHGIAGLANVYRVDAVAYDPAANNRLPLPFAGTTLASMIALAVNGTNVRISTGTNRTAYTTTYVTLFYTKS
ncbi:MAG TPA: hypothetical protein VFH61_03955 [Thermoleophilia bacterium]|nr:hypothetical protein [Thermoleophilia bacterium]